MLSAFEPPAFHLLPAKMNSLMIQSHNILQLDKVIGITNPRTGSMFDPPARTVRRASFDPPPPSFPRYRLRETTNLPNVSRNSDVLLASPSTYDSRSSLQNVVRRRRINACKVSPSIFRNFAKFEQLKFKTARFA